MSESLAVRAMTDEEARALRELAHSRTAQARLRDRARICWLSHPGQRVAAIKAALGIADGTVRLWITRVNVEGLDGLHDRRRGGRPATYTPEQVGELVAASLTDPQDLGLPFASWTLDRLAAYRNEERGIAMRRSRMGEILQTAGLRWRQQETWFGERPDPAFAAKRGPSSRSTPPRPRTAW
jgi:transposase